MYKKLVVVCLFLLFSINRVQGVEAWCGLKPEGICLRALHEDNNKVKALLDRVVIYQTIFVGYDLTSSRSWFSMNERMGVIVHTDIASNADYDDEANESVWFTAYRAIGAQCWLRSELLYFYDDWSGKNIIERPVNYPSSRANNILLQDMINRVNPNGYLTDNQGREIYFCQEESSVTG
jgi:hypothetical protein